MSFCHSLLDLLSVCTKRRPHGGEPKRICSKRFFLSVMVATSVAGACSDDGR